MGARMKDVVVWFLVILFTSCCASVGSALGPETSPVAVPHFTLQELESPESDGALLQAWTSSGLLTVQLSSEEERVQSASLRQSALTQLCDCQSQHPGTFESFVLQNSHAQRHSLATATIGTTPLSLHAHLACNDDTVLTLEALRDHVALVSQAFIRAFDRVLRRSNPHYTPLLASVHGNSYGTIQSIVQSANHLEHFHIYEQKPTATEQHDSTALLHPPNSNNHENLALDWHTDAGLFLAFVPAFDCQHASAADRSFHFRSSQQRGDEPPISADFTSDSVVFMLGAGAQYWLHTQVPLQATRHALHMQEHVRRRAWYGMMYLVPDSAILQTVPTTRTFADMKQSNLQMRPQQQRQDQHHEEPLSIGCGVHQPVPNEEVQQPALSSRRRMQQQQLHDVEPSACNNVTNFFCWMSCLEVPNPDQAAGYLSEGYELYCLDPVVLAQSGNRVSKAMEPCLEGNVHNSNCLGSWQPAAPGIEGAPIQVERPDFVSETDQEQYCYGGTSMYMDGFHWTHAICVIYLFPSWVLSTPGKLTAASLGTLVVGMVLEAVIWKRRTIMASLQAGNQRLLMSAGFYGVQLTLGYMIMLVVMTYSGVLFLCSILGIVCGHILFNAKDAVFLRKRKPKTGGRMGNKQLDDMDGIVLASNQKPTQHCGDERCSTSNTYGAIEGRTLLSDTELGGEGLSSGDGTGDGVCKCHEGIPKTETEWEEEEDDGILEGSTPCCQHSLAL